MFAGGGRGELHALTFINVMQFQVELYLIEYFGVKAVVKADAHTNSPSLFLSLFLYPSVPLPSQVKQVLCELFELLETLCIILAQAATAVAYCLNENLRDFNRVSPSLNETKYLG